MRKGMREIQMCYAIANWGELYRSSDIQIANLFKMLKILTTLLTY